jgi:hypothetical protein
MGGSSRGAVVLLALLLLFGNAKCMMACALGPCHTSASQTNLPPCHRHRAPANEAPPACSHLLAIADAGQVRDTHLARPFLLAAPASPFLASVDLWTREYAATPVCAASPPGGIAISIFILRI